MAFTGSFVNVATTDQLSTASGMLGDTLQIALNSMYTLFQIFLSFVQTPAVLGALTVLGVVYTVWRVVRRRSHL